MLDHKGYLKLNPILEPFLPSTYESSNIRDPKIRRLLQMITSSSALSKMSSGFGLHMNKLAFNIASRFSIESGRKLLDEINKTQLEIETIKTKMNSIAPSGDLESFKSTQKNLILELKEAHQRLIEINNSYYEHIPHVEYAETNLKMLDSYSISNEMKLLDQLIYTEDALKILIAAKHREQTINPLDYSYKALNTDIKYVDIESYEYQNIKSYIDCTGGKALKYILLNLYQVNKASENLTKFRDSPNHYLLFHGTSSHNLFGILASGLKIAPIESNHHGSLYGRGIYFTDLFSKAHQYSTTIPLCNTTKNFKVNFKYVLLCEVVVGAEKSRKNNLINYSSEGISTTKVANTNDYDLFEESLHSITGFEIPYLKSKVVSNSITEYVAASTDQVKIRYVAELITN